MPVISSGFVLLSPVIPVAVVPAFDPQLQQGTGDAVQYTAGQLVTGPNDSSSPVEQTKDKDWWSVQGTPATQRGKSLRDCSFSTTPPK